MVSCVLQAPGAYCTYASWVLQCVACLMRDRLAIPFVDSRLTLVLRPRRRECDT